MFTDYRKPYKSIPFLEVCCVIGDNGISMSLHSRRREINGSSPSWRIRKKKKSYGARAEVEIHESTYVVGAHSSEAPQAWTPANLRKVATRIPGAGQPPPPTARGAGGALSVSGASGSLRRHQRTPARPGTSGPRFHPGTFKANLRASRVPEADAMEGKKGPPATRPSWCVPPPPASVGAAP